MKTIIRLDDFGMTKSINEGIKLVLEKLPVNNISVMTNTSNSIEALRFIKNKKKICAGLHVNISCGNPLTDSESLINPVTKKFYSSKDINNFSQLNCPFKERDLYEEIISQLQTFKIYSGRLPDYLDLHAVNQPIIYQVMKKVGQEFNIRYTEDLNNPNIIFHHIQFNQYDYYSKHKNIFFLDSIQLNSNKINHFVFHPGFIDKQLIYLTSLTTGRLCDLNVLLSEEFEYWIKQNEVKYITFKQINL
ncbi:ChbG/HpnK family deacetylase [Virgibacillus proomii]|uniref:ChbG/HpnK family deacetylase n=1 Tax=Virgibacillus proomii TaxID=84407 RepID=UPI001C1222CF|nr:ChbG/HpnK family deacetylase [Virgibacillus proomii]MBU5268111.1 ChbG/HpnK family deacetylase [Virgibacillus proomii]